MVTAARAVVAQILTGDTKVVDRGHGDAQIKSLNSVESHSAGDNFDAFRKSFVRTE
jgi:hydrogenase maturation factor